MDKEAIQRIRSLEIENEKQLAELTALRETLDSLAKHVCISSDEFLAGWAFKYGKARPHLERELHRVFNNFTGNVPSVP